MGIPSRSDLNSTTVLQRHRSAKFFFFFFPGNPSRITHQHSINSANAYHTDFGFKSDHCHAPNVAEISVQIPTASESTAEISSFP